ncbi:uncharacterized protein LOC116002358 [Ipomoea triloba]|uniref:uncharacterized protein LOC116002358 n=1 Tax=Ipomoea triloba TaxID=35885 RepID=UPI00125DE3B0|nr:uncharacterized protein LOC116002358 [Ipomoea triloba]
MTHQNNLTLPIFSAALTVSLFHSLAAPLLLHPRTAAPLLIHRRLRISDSAISSSLSIFQPVRNRFSSLSAFASLPSALASSKPISKHTCEAIHRTNGVFEPFTVKIEFAERLIEVREMGCVALTSLMATIELEFLQPNHRVSLVDDDEKPLKSLLQKLSYMEAFVKKEYNNAVGGAPI